jgi:hypothetical protein
LLTQLTRHWQEATDRFIKRRYKMNQPTLFTYPNSPGWKRQDTSKDAAKAIEPRAATLRNKVWQILKSAPMTADACADVLEEDKLSIRPRVSELLKLGKVVDTGFKAVNRSGKKAIVWRGI